MSWLDCSETLPNRLLCGAFSGTVRVMFAVIPQVFDVQLVPRMTGPPLPPSLYRRPADVADKEAANSAVAVSYRIPCPKCCGARKRWRPWATGESEHQ